MTCKDCIHYIVCPYRLMGTKNGVVERASEVCKHFKDKSLFIELPCKTGKSVYVVDNDYWDGKSTKTAIFNRVLDYFVIDSLGNKYFVSTSPYELHIKFEDFGKTVFLTKEEAKKKLKEMSE